MVGSLRLYVAAVVAGSFACASTVHAHDDHDDRSGKEGNHVAIAVDFDYTTAVSNELDIEYGGGGAIRVGLERDLVLVTLIPELELAYHNFGGGENHATTTSGKLGGRLRFLKILEPGIFAHAGLGHISGDDPHYGFALDAGLTLDFTLLPLIDLGLHAAWNRVFDADSLPGLSYGTYGAHVAFVF